MTPETTSVRGLAVTSASTVQDSRLVVRRQRHVGAFAAIQRDTLLLNKAAYLETTDGVVVTKSGSQYWGLCIRRESVNHVNVGPVSIWDVKEQLRTTSTLAVTVLGATIERSAWRDVLIKAD